MPLVKVLELEGAALDWAVAKCEGHEQIRFRGCLVDPKTLGDGGSLPTKWRPSANWAQGGPIIRREKISIRQWTNAPVVHAYMPFDGAEWFEDGESPLIAAMRCYVASKLGASIEIPEELTRLW